MGRYRRVHRLEQLRDEPANHNKHLGLGLSLLVDAIEFNGLLKGEVGRSTFDEI
jgi:hypothetical protein